jgi:hypothetical protein
MVSAPKGDCMTYSTAEWCAFALSIAALAGCSGPAEPTADASVDAGAEADAGSDSGSDASVPRPRYSGLVSIQDVSVLGLPQAGHGLTVVADLTDAPRAPDFDETPGALTGCKGWLYELESEPLPARSGDEGVLSIRGLRAWSPLSCSFTPAGYVCPVAQGETMITAAPGPVPGSAALSFEIAALVEDHAGLYLRIAGSGSYDGAFPIVGVPSATSMLVAGFAADASFSATYSILAGVGPVPSNPRDPIADGDEVTLSLEPHDGAHFVLEETTVIAGGAFTPDEATNATLASIPVDGRAITLGCGGPGGSCGPADATVVLLTTTDGSIAGLGPTAMPPPVRTQAVVRCAVLGGDGTLTVPDGAMDLLRRAHAASPIRRIRTALMREGVAVAISDDTPDTEPMPLLVGHGLLGFTTDP